MSSFMYVTEVEIAGEWVAWPRTAANNKQSCEAISSALVEAHQAKRTRTAVYISAEARLSCDDSEELVSRWIASSAPWPDSGAPIATDAVLKMLRLAAADFLLAKSRRGHLSDGIRKGEG